MKIINLYTRIQVLVGFIGALLIPGFLMSALLLQNSVVQADDVEVYLKPPPKPLPPNILFILDESGSMSSASLTDGKNRNTALKDAMKAVIADPKLNNVNAAIMGYTTKSGDSSAISNLDVRTMHDFITMDTAASQQSLIAAVDTLKMQSFTPSSRAIERGVQWFKTGWDGNASPLDSVNYCAANSIVFLTDGEPNANSMTTYEGTNCISDAYSYYSGGRCSPEIAAWAYDTDLEPTWAGTQNIVTYTVSMITSSGAVRYLRSVAREGHGFPRDCGGLSAGDTALCEDDEVSGFYLAGGEEALVDALKSIVEKTQFNVKYSFNTPSIPLNASDAASSGDYIYVPILVPNIMGSWKGNLKKYKLSRTADGTIQILDSNGASAVDTNPLSKTFNQFLSTAQSYWDADSINDGDEPLLGGVTEQMALYKQIDDIIETDFNKMLLDDLPVTGDIRRLFTYIEGSSTSTSLKDDGNRVIPSNDPDDRCSENTNIIPALLDVATTNTCHDVLEWLVTGSYDTGEDYPDEHEKAGEDIIDYKFGAPIHTKPVVIGDRIYIPTSDGILHAFDTATGKELWGYIPEEMLFDVKNHKTPSERKPIYGLDGEITLVHKDSNENFQVDNGERAMLVFGQRRGGKNYWAIEVTDKNNPKFVYQIKGGEGSFTKLAQTWSKPVFAIEDHGDTGTDVLIFGGGYDADQDAVEGSRTADDEGNVIYVIDAWSGDRKAEIPASTNGIAARITTMDMDSDGMVDRLYAADVGGRIIRADIDQSTASSSWKSGVIADVGGSPNVKFFNQPAVAFESGANAFLSINIGTGNRSKPLEATKDSFYMFKDPNIWITPNSYPVVNKADMIDVTDTSFAKLTKELKVADGWYYDLPVGAKVFSKASVLDYVVVFTTYTETDEAIEICKASGSEGEAAIYALHMLTGRGMFVKSDATRVTHKAINISGIPPSPVLTTTGGEPADPNDPNDKGLPGSNDIMVGLEQVLSFPQRIYQLNWEEVINE